MEPPNMPCNIGFAVHNHHKKTGNFLNSLPAFRQKASTQLFLSFSWSFRSISKARSKVDYQQRIPWLTHKVPQMQKIFYTKLRL